MSLLLGGSPAIEALRSSVQRVGPTGLTVLITGESGTGKEVVCRALHEASGRSGTLVPVDCAAIPANLLESELFGHEKGAFTGASTRRRGLVEAAEGGTFFLDEIGELTSEVQVKLLRLLQEREFRRVGGEQQIGADIRVVAATNRRLEEQVAAGSFRRDLFHRLNVVRLELPPLRDRPEDIPALLYHFVERFRAQTGLPALTLDGPSLAVLRGYPWPGNVRELVNCAHYLASLAPGPSVQIADLPPRIRSGRAQAPARSGGPGVQHHLPYKEARALWLEHFEREYVQTLLQAHGGNVTQAARSAGIDRKSIQRMVKRLGLRRDDS